MNAFFSRTRCTPKQLQHRQQQTQIRAAFFIGERGFDQVHPRSIHEGFLSKTGGSNKRFRRRYVVLLSDRLLYFRKKGDAKCAGSVELSSRSLVTPGPPPPVFAWCLLCVVSG